MLEIFVEDFVIKVFGNFDGHNVGDFVGHNVGYLMMLEMFL